MTGDHDDQDLEAFFDAARDRAGPGDDLVARVLADAAAVQAVGEVPAAPARAGWLEAIGGWITVSGLAAACAAGVAIGVMVPATLSAGFDTVLGTQAADSFAGFDVVTFADDFEVSQ